MLSDLLGLIAIFLTVKGLGGTFNVLFDRAGLSFFHGPVIGLCVAFSLCLYFFCFRQPDHNLLPSRLQRRAFWILFAILFAITAALKLRAIIQTPLDVTRADPLFIVQGQLQHLLGGWSPYTKIQLPNGQWIYHGYLPGIWLSYLPLYALGADLRFLNLCAHLLIYALLALLFLKKGRLLFQKFWPSALVFFVVLSLHIFSKQTQKELIDIQTGGFWISLSLFLWAAATQRCAIATAFVPWLVLCREPAFLFVVPYFWYLFQIDRKKCFVHGTFVVGAVLLVMGPLLLWDASGFFAGMRYYSTVGASTDPQMMARFYGLSGLLKRHGLYGAPVLLQLVTMGLMLGSAFFIKRPSLPAHLGRGACAYICFILLVTITYQYLFAEPLLLAYFLLLWPSGEDLSRI